MGGENICTILVQTNSGERIRRRFHVEEKVENVLVWLAYDQIATTELDKMHELMLPYSGTALDASATLESLGITDNCLLRARKVTRI